MTPVSSQQRSDDIIVVNDVLSRQQQPAQNAQQTPHGDLASHPIMSGQTSMSTHNLHTKQTARDAFSEELLRPSSPVRDNGGRVGQQYSV
jgi:hypothetical protein